MANFYGSLIGFGSGGVGLSPYPTATGGDTIATVDTNYKVHTFNAAADFVWYILTGALVISTTYNSILDISCSYSKQQKSSAAANYHTQQAAAKKNKKETKYFTIHD